MLAIPPYTKLSHTAVENFRKWLLVTDPPIHTRLRAAVSRAFTPKRIAEFEPRIREISDDLLVAMVNDDEPDVVPAFTAGLPIYAIAAILGLPTERWDWLRESSAEVGRMLEALEAFDPDSMSRRFDELHMTFTELIRERRAAPRDDLVSALVADESRLTDNEVISMITVLMFAGHETTTGLMGNSIVALARHPEQRELLRSRPELIDNAVEELLRFDTTAQFSGRNTTGPIEAGDVTIPGGSNVGTEHRRCEPRPTPLARRRPAPPRPTRPETDLVRTRDPPLPRRVTGPPRNADRHPGVPRCLR